MFWRFPLKYGETLLPFLCLGEPTSLGGQANNKQPTRLRLAARFNLAVTFYPGIDGVFINITLNSFKESAVDVPEED